MAALTKFSVEDVKKLAKDLPLDDLKDKTDSAFSGDMINYSLAACYLACQKGLGLVPFDEQLIAAYEIFNDKIIHMNTGEGKTIAAVFAAYLKIKAKHKVHILTFNDYLAKRDCKWMKPITDLLGLKTGYLLESTAREERRELYKCDILYSTVKEIGFDFLRDFTAIKENDVIQPGFDVAIVDEADSILIDEARIPLVIAGDLPVYISEQLPDISAFVGTFNTNDYGVSEEDGSAYLKNPGTSKTEEHFGVENLYDNTNIGLLSAVNDCLKARYLLKQDKDYIVADNEIKLVDEYTGRVAANRHYPGSLHAAVETLHGIPYSSHGVEMGIIPIQFFVRQYKSLCGMTGTASDSEEEFELLYGLELKVIPPHMPCIRKDHGISVYYNSDIKTHEVINEIVKRHQKGQPILAGTASISESERLAKLLADKGINVKVLNAKQDEQEAEIIKNAGALNAVTISTNIAGRGVDILLGGADLATREEVIKAGGLCVISTGMRESSRINKQLIGRAGRQGDIGESMIFVSLDEEIMERGGLKKLLPGKRLPEYTEGKITEKTLLREVRRVQRIVEGDMLDRRKQLLKFTVIGEKHRDATFSYRKKILTGKIAPDFWQSENPDLYELAVSKHGEEKINELQIELAAASINEAWCDYLEYTSDLRRGIHLTKVGGKSPSDEYNISSEEYFNKMEGQVSEIMACYLKDITDINDLALLKVNKPSKTWTYLLDESVDELAKQPFLVNVLTEYVLDEEEEKIEATEKTGFFKKLFKLN
ncbi:MAG: preprotein translocase subunit SecA [Eubacterium sp.]|jgi:preprotein translocase subunit SecA|nr:preprotein translocase subunit SecA [Eubacterium sp.]